MPKKLEYRYEVMFENMAQGAFFQQADGSLFDVNPAALEMFGLTRDEYLERISFNRDWQVLDENGSPLPPERYPSKIALKTGQPVHNFVVEVFNHKKNRRVWLNINAIPLFGGGKTPEQVFVTLDDISEKKQIERQIIKSQQQLRFLADQVPVLIAHVDKQRQYKFVNMPYAKFFGFHPANIIGKHTHEVIGEERYNEVTPYTEDVLSGKTVEFDIDLQTPQGGAKTFHTRYAPEKNEKGDVVGFIAAFMDITSRKQIESELLNNQYYLRKAQQLGKIGTWELDIINNKLVWTEENCRIFGVPEGTHADYQCFISKVHPDDRSYVEHKWQKAMEGEPYDIEHRLLINGETSWVREKANVTFSSDGKAISAIGFTQDITERVKAEQTRMQLEEDLQHARKLEALGTMAGGIAHNFNNNLAIILGNTEMAKLKCSDHADVQKFLDNAHQAILRSRDLVKQILIYSRQGIGEKKTIKASSIINGTFRLLKSAYPTTVVLKLHIPAEIESIYLSADETRIEEALINLCNNAVQSMKDNGTLDINLARTNISEEQIPKNCQCEPGPYLSISISDTGCGIPDDMIEKIFDPFFTTKEVNEGTGMGLSTVRGIIDTHNGFIKVESEVEVGTTFDLYLPIEHEANPETDTPQTPVDGSGTILFVDDEEMLAELGRIMLEEMGYQVVSLTNPLQALKKITEEPNRFDLVITDQTMPDLTGKELAQKIKQIRPDLPIILCTGHSSQSSADNSKDSGINAFCQKPLKMGELEENVRRYISAGENGS